MSHVYQTKEPRQSNLELFRIILMIGIIAHHYVVNSGLLKNISLEPTTANSVFLLLFGAWGKTGINCFLLITGFFMCQQTINSIKFFKLLFEIVFYNVLFFLIFSLSGYSDFSFRSMLSSIWPIHSVTKDFSSCFLLFFLCIPFINIMIRGMTKTKHFMLLCLLFFSYTILPSLRIPILFNYITWFGIVYLLAAYVRLYPFKNGNNTKLWFFIMSSSILFSCLTIIIFIKSSKPYFFLEDCNKILAVTTAFSAFLFFRNVPIKYNRTINRIAQTTLGVLLIHANSDIMRQWLWRDTLKNTTYFSEQYCWLHALLSVVAVYVICVIIDSLRIIFVERPFFRWWNNHMQSRIELKYERIQCLINRFL